MDDAIALAARLPWGLSLVLASVSFIVLTVLSGHFARALTANSGADVARPIVNAIYGTAASVGRWVLASVFLIGAGASWWGRRHGAGLFVGVARDPAAIDHLSWREFERLIGEAYRRQGYAVTELGGDGPDGGVDLVLRRDGRETLVQCKQWRRKSVGVVTVRELRGVMAQRGAAAGVVVGLHGFTPEAATFAREGGIEVLDASGVAALVRGVPVETWEESPTRIGAAPMHTCPRCGSVMVRRVAGQGPHAGEAFFGCSRYPTCRGIVSA
ncbi:MAG: restriction endonuclease [Steroidobacteraceae bacterium]